MKGDGHTGKSSSGGGSQAHVHHASRRRGCRIFLFVATAFVVVVVSCFTLLGYGAIQWDNNFLRAIIPYDTFEIDSSFVLEGYNVVQSRRLGGELVGCNTSCIKLLEERGIRSWHFWKDDELIKTALAVKAPPANEMSPPRKIAFLFLTRAGITHIKLWERFFKGNRDLYSIYIHVADPGMRLYKSSKIFWGRQIPSESTSWGSVALVEAEKRLLANAYLDPFNERFILLSESCIPVRPFKWLYDFLIQSPKSYVGCFNPNNPSADGRWNEGFLPLVPREHFRKGSQWFELMRKHVRVVLTDTKYWGATKMLWVQPEEHYLQTLFYLLGIQDEMWHATLTDVDWSRPEGQWGEHPHTYTPSEVSRELIQRLRGISDSTFFARKFGEPTREPLLAVGKDVLGF